MSHSTAELDEHLSSDPSQVRRVAIASAFGTGIELYDFLIFGLAAGLVFPKLFFPQSDPLVGTLLAFMTFGAGFVSRPIGGLVFGHFGDRVSRRLMLVISLATTGLCTLLMGCLPTYATIGVAAPILLVVLRILQGFFMGGEQSGAFLMVTEHAPAGRKAFFGASATAGSPIGSILGLLAFQITAAATGPSFLTWGWRIPFLLSVVLIGIGLWVRLGLHESPVFKAMQSERETTGHLPIAGVMKKGLGLMVAGILVQLGFNQFIFIINSFSNAYGTQQLKMSRQDLLVSGLAGSAAMLITVFIASALADRIGLFSTMMIGAVFQIAWAFPYFWLFNTRSVPMLYVAVVVAYIGLSFVFGPMAAYFVSLFDPEHRYSGVALSYNVGAVLGGGLSPFVAQWLMKDGYGSTGISTYILLGGVLSVIGLLMSRKRVATHFPRRVRS
ncbi:MFS transporter [Mariniluteicoccus flavus]